VGDLLRRVATEVPDRVALVDGDAPHRRWTYAELLAAAERVAGNLLARFAPGDRIAVWGSNSPEWIITQLGSALAGMVFVAVDPAYRAAELAYGVGPARGGTVVPGTGHEPHRHRRTVL
jgi:fatty-acyl-CoA synthase